MVKSIPQLSLEVVYPPADPKINLNTCGDPDCGNYGVAPDFALPVFKGRNAAQRKLLASTNLPALATGRGVYTLSGEDKRQRTSAAFEYADDPHVWDDGRVVVCRHQKANHECGVSFSLLSNEHLLDEVERLETQNGSLEGPACGSCGARYLDHPDEFIFNGAHGKSTKVRGGRPAKPTAFRLIHKPCKGLRGSRFSVSLDHQSQEKQHDNVRILRALVNGASINDLRRLLADPDTGKKCGVSRIYNRIFWLEKTLLSFERAKLREWKRKSDGSEEFNHTRVAHDDVVISVNWESKSDRRLTPVHCSVSADIRSGYVFRVDANFDPRVDPVRLCEEHYIHEGGGPKGLRREYTQKSGKVFTAPLLHFQRPSGRFDEAALFASAEGSWRVFSERLVRAFESDPAGLIILPAEVRAQLKHADCRRRLLDEIRHRYFDFSEADRDFRGSFKGSLVKPTYTKAAHLACLRDMLPEGKITLVGEQENTMVRVVPHVFRDLIKADLFEWFVISFDKSASTPKTNRRIRDFQKDFEAFKARASSITASDNSNFDWLTQFCADGLTPAMNVDHNGQTHPFSFFNFRSAQFPQLWVRSPVQAFGETQKVVGFPLIRSAYRRQLKGLAFDQLPHDHALRSALARRALTSTLQPVSAFMNSLRTRLSPTDRAGGRSARNGPSYINGALFNPAVLIALLNIYRVYYNWFEARQYTGGNSAEHGASAVPAGTSAIRVPGSDQIITVPKRREQAPILRTPAMRLGLSRVRDKASSQQAPDPRRILYRPWLFHGTPLWKKFEGR